MEDGKARIHIESATRGRHKDSLAGFEAYREAEFVHKTTMP